MVDDVATTWGGKITLGRAPASNEILLGNSTGDFALTPASSILPTNVGYLNIPINSQSAAYSTVLGDSGKAILHPVTDNNARTFTIDAAVAYDLGTVITFINRINTLTISLSSGTMYLGGTATTGNRTLAVNGVATAIKAESAVWIISGAGLS